jgi:hypothetical protein
VLRRSPVGLWHAFDPVTLVADCRADAVWGSVRHSVSRCTVVIVPRDYVRRRNRYADRWRGWDENPTCSSSHLYGRGHRWAGDRGRTGRRVELFEHGLLADPTNSLRGDRVGVPLVLSPVPVARRTPTLAPRSRVQARWSARASRQGCSPTASALQRSVDLPTLRTWRQFSASREEQCASSGQCRRLRS